MLQQFDRAEASTAGTIVVIGAGPHALTLCAYLLAARSDWRSRLIVIDPLRWLESWNATLARMEIDVLRSPCVHHPEPDPYALFTFAQDRPDELVGPYRAPSTRLFDDFCVISIRQHDLGSALVRSCVTGIDPITPSLSRLTLNDGGSLEATVVVLATNPRRPRVPDWVRDGLPVAHAGDVDVHSVTAGQKIVVVGGGLTAAQLALAAHRRRAEVTLVSRAALRCSTTDFDPRWIGPHFLEQFFAEAHTDQRAASVAAARRGSMPESWADRVRSLARSGSLRLWEGADALPVHQVDDSWRIKTSHGETAIDQVWLATGWYHDVCVDPLLGPLVRSRSTGGGLPLLDEACRIPDTNVHVMGGAAALQIGPAASNLVGARMAAERIVGHLVQLPKRQYPTP